MVEDGQILWGYENERVTGVKSDSRFPEQAVAYAAELGLPTKADMVYVSHWSPDGQLKSMSAKHWQPSYFDGMQIRTHDVDRSHHDAHMACAMAYAGPEFLKLAGDRVHGVVVDGFGTMGEHFTVYRFEDGKPRIVRRIRGYDTSLGLWYQYATAFLGLKMHEDEYKLLGYETRVDPDIKEDLSKSAALYAMAWADRMDQSTYGSEYDPVYNLDALKAVREKIFSDLGRICHEFQLDPMQTSGRAAVAFFVQQVLERVVLDMIMPHRPTGLLLSGGVFFNVKLNKILIDATKGLVCVCPLAGDQGNGLGLYALDNPDFEFPRDLNWGRRVLRPVGNVPGLIVVDDEGDALDIVYSKLQSPGFVNVVRGGMEFGPRALCNTSTLAIPTMENVARINDANNRNTVMPMAPVMTHRMYSDLFENWQGVWRSQEHMIVALQYREPPMAHLLGAAHEYKSNRGTYWTGRPQVARPGDKLMQCLLAATDHPLINTSFNFHGKPIALGMPSIVDNHMMQWTRDNSFFTVVIRNDQ